MSDEQVQPEPLRFTQHVVHLVDRWPALTSFTAGSLQQVHHIGGRYDEAAGTVTFDVFNGEAVYRLIDPVPMLFSDPAQIRGELVEDAHKLTSRRP